jgi:hypothetical protein
MWYFRVIIASGAFIALGALVLADDWPVWKRAVLGVLALMLALSAIAHL